MGIFLFFTVAILIVRDREGSMSPLVRIIFLRYMARYLLSVKHRWSIFLFIPCNCSRERPIHIDSLFPVFVGLELTGQANPDQETTLGHTWVGVLILGLVLQAIVF